MIFTHLGGSATADIQPGQRIVHVVAIGFVLFHILGLLGAFDPARKRLVARLQQRGAVSVAFAATGSATGPASPSTRGKGIKHRTRAAPLHGPATDQARAHNDRTDDPGQR